MLADADLSQFNVVALLWREAGMPMKKYKPEQTIMLLRVTAITDEALELRRGLLTESLQTPGWNKRSRCR
jgi:hypothetical protein